MIMSRSTTRVCHLCCSSSSSTRCSALFSKEAIQRDLPGRLSNLLQLPVSDSDGLSSYLCRSCMGKFTTVESKLESFRSMAKAGYEKGRQESQVPISSFNGSNPPLASHSTYEQAQLLENARRIPVDLKLLLILLRLGHLLSVSLLVPLEEDLLSLVDRIVRTQIIKIAHTS